MMASSKISRSFMLFRLILAHLLLYTNYCQASCSSALGMENGNITDSQITVSHMRTSAAGNQARLNRNISPWGGWCIAEERGKRGVPTFDEYIQIDLLHLTKVTKIATQGREFNQGREFAKEYKISYSRDNLTWVFVKENDNDKIFQGNKDVTNVVTNTIDPSIVARYVRIYPGYTFELAVCMRLELYGCIGSGFDKSVASYSLPVGQKTKNNKNKYEDTSYNGAISNAGLCSGGTGILTDGQYGPVNSKQNKGVGWVGWSSLTTESKYIEITFEFIEARKFKDVTLTVNVDNKRSNAVFNRSRIFFASKENDFSQTLYLQYCPAAKNASQQNANITLSLCGNIAKFVRLQLYFGGKWLLLTEVRFTSDSVGDGNMENSFKDCSKDSPLTCTLSGTSTTLIPACIDCSTLPPSHQTPVASSSDKVPVTVIIICVILILLFVILLLVLLFCLYRRRALCFGRLKQKKNMDKTVHVELQQVENGEEPTYDKIPDGNPLYASVGEDDTKPMLSPVKKKSAENLEAPDRDARSSELYAEPEFNDSKPFVQDEYAEPMDTLQPRKTDDALVGNPIYEGIYSEPLYGIAGTILVGPQDETLKRGYTMEKFPRDRLTFKEKIGDGQFGEVHIAEADIRDLNTQFGEGYTGKTKVTVAVKTLKGNVKKDVKTDFFKEVRVMSRLQHENVVRLLGVCRDDPICMIVEYMENGDLNQFLKGHVLEDNDDVMVYANTKQPISFSELVYITSQVAAGMKYFAAMNFVHRDLAARNCLVGEGLTVKLADFGMSRLLYSKHYYRVQGRVMLPIRWMAPESIFQGRFTTQTDVWSFGITLWEIFTLAEDFPYPDLADEQVIGNAKTAFTKGDSNVVYNEKPEICPQDIFDMMLACWSSNPEQRPDFNKLYTFLQGKVGSAGPVRSAVV